MGLGVYSSQRHPYLKRRSRFMDALVRHGLMPNEILQRKALEHEDPWTLRVKGLDEELSLYQLGRALFHLQQRRGFKSNRKTDAGRRLRSVSLADFAFVSR